jgi:hypothetical protein
MDLRSPGGAALNTSVRILLALVAIATGLGAAPRAGRAGQLEVYEASVGPGTVRTIAGPVTNALLDVDYAPASAEGGRLFGLSELEIEATGNLVLTPTGFGCQATSCLYSPLPFATGKRIRVTAGNDLVGETAAAANLLTVGVTGSAGNVVVTGGGYLDGTGTAGSVGAVQTADVVVLLTVPEPALATGLAAASALLGLAVRSRLRTASASARSGRAPGGRAPRAR